MTNETIRPGDLVMVVRPQPCCGDTSCIGDIFRVQGVEFRRIGGCIHCGSKNRGYLGVQKSGRRWFLASRLKKLNPPVKQEATEKEKEMA